MGIRLIKAKFEARDSGISIVEEAFFTPDEVELLELYSENYERMIGSRIFENSFPSLEKLSISSVEGISCIVSKFDHRDLYELLHVLRPFILLREPASFAKVLSIFGKRLNGDLFRTAFKQFRQLFKDGNHSFTVNLSSNGTNLFSDKLFSAWLNGLEYHGDIEKKNFIENLEDKFGANLVQGAIVSVLKGRVMAIGMLNNIVQVPLNMGMKTKSKESENLILNK